MHRTLLALTAGLLATAGAASAMQGSDLDVDGDGFATIAEVRQVLGGLTSSDFRKLDVNRDNRLSANELNASGTTEIIGKYRDSMTIVHGLSDVDQNGDRFLTIEELRAVYKGLLDSEFRDIDVNRDRRVSAKELYSPLAQALVTRYEMGGRMLVTAMQVDTNDDFFISFEELTQSYPSLTQVDFEMIDLNGDNRVAAIEYYNPESQAILDRK